MGLGSQALVINVFNLFIIRRDLRLLHNPHPRHHSLHHHNLHRLHTKKAKVMIHTL